MIRAVNVMTTIIRIILNIYFSKKMMYLVERFEAYAKHNHKRSKQKRQGLMNSFTFPYSDILIKETHTGTILHTWIGETSLSLSVSLSLSLYIYIYIFVCVCRLKYTEKFHSRRKLNYVSVS